MKKLGILFCSTLLAIVVAAACPALGRTAFAASNPDATAKKPTVTIENGTFESSTGNWTVDRCGYSDDSSFGGVLDLATKNTSLVNTFKYTEDELKDLEDPANPDAVVIPDDDSVGKGVLFIRNKLKSICKYTSDSFTIPARSFVQISLNVITCVSADETFGAYVRFGGDLGDVVFGPIRTTGTSADERTWQTVTLFVKGHAYKDLSATISLELGDTSDTDGNTVSQAVRGWAAFDNVVADSLTEVKYNEQFGTAFGADVKHEPEDGTVKTADPNTKSFLPESNPDKLFSKIDSAEFRNEWKNLENNNISCGPYNTAAWPEIIVKDGDDPLENPSAPASEDESDILALVGYYGASAYGGVESVKTIPVPRFSYLRISVWVYADSDIIQSGTASVKATVVGADDDTTATNADLGQEASVTSFSAQNTDNYTGNWGEAVILVKGSPFYDRELRLELSAGTESSPFVGAVYFDRVTYQTISGADYATLSGTKLEMKTAASDSATESVTNGNFNTVGDADADAALLPATGWTVSGGDEESRVYGIAALDAEYLRAQYEKEPALKGVDHPDLDAQNAFLLLHKEATHSVLTSSDITSTASTVNRVNLKILNRFEGTVKLRLYAGDIVAVEKTVKKSAQPTRFDNAVLSVKLGTATPTLKLEIELGTEDETGLGYIWIDTVYADTAENAEADVDYTGDLFDFVTDNGDIVLANRAWERIGSFDDKDETKLAGFVKRTVSSEAYSWVEELCDGANGDYILLLRATEPTSIGLRQSVAATYTASEFVRITLRVKTRGFEKGTGARIELNDSNCFEAVNSQYLTDSELNDPDVVTQVTDGVYGGWRTYTFLVNVGATDGLTTNLVVRIGKGQKETELATGTIAIDGITVETITESDYEEALEAYDEATQDNVKNVMLSESAPEENETPAPTVDNTGCSDTALWLVPTLLLGIAVIVAVVGVAIRKVASRPHKQKVKGAATYDRRNTVKVVSERGSAAKPKAQPSDEEPTETPDEADLAEEPETEEAQEPVEEPAIEEDESVAPETEDAAPDAETEADKPEPPAPFDTFDD